MLGEVALNCVYHATMAWNVGLRILLVLAHGMVPSVRGVVVMSSTTAVFKSDLGYLAELG
jgi:hypothetical protein